MSHLEVKDLQLQPSISSTARVGAGSESGTNSHPIVRNTDCWWVNDVKNVFLAYIRPDSN